MNLKNTALKDTVWAELRNMLEITGKGINFEDVINKEENNIYIYIERKMYIYLYKYIDI
jgi:hypothetical protein